GVNDDFVPIASVTEKVILIKENKTWKDALNYCRDHYHDLVTITNQDEQRRVQEKAKNALTPFVWIGLRYICLKEIWFWVCKESLNLERQNDCDMSGAMETRGEHRWFQRNDTEELNFICSKV
ncbi:hypothetical protein GOODEAATRI_031476, partial [Goodea atripinnis]